jgi:hypothetical protein
MGDVFTILALTQFGPGPALITYWLNMIVGHAANLVKDDGIRGFAKVKVDKVLFNLASCVLCVGAMWVVYKSCMALHLSYPANFVLGLGG